MIIEKIRVSIGSAVVLGLVNKKFKDPPTTCYLMTYLDGHCIANCSFCPQARDSYSNTEKLSRISWPVFLFKDFLMKMKYLPPSKRFRRICIQTLNYKNNYRDINEIITEIKKISNIPISVAIPPMNKERLERLKLIGVQRIGIALDGSTPEIFNKIKGKEIDGPYKWETHIKTLDLALEIFPKNSITTHIIIGLGEMLELGSESKKAHRKAGMDAAKCGADYLVVLGDHSLQMIKGANDEGMDKDRTFIAENHEDMAEIIRNKMERGTLVFLKGSRGIQLDKVVKYLVEKVK